MLAQAAKLERAVMPAYTHLQRAQPVSGAHWMLSHFWPLQRDRERLAAARAHTASLPLGSGAIAGSAFPVARARLGKSLGFATISQNSIDAVGDRDFVAEVLFTLSLARRASLASGRGSHPLRLERVRVRAVRGCLLDRIVDDAAEAES